MRRPRQHFLLLLVLYLLTAVTFAASRPFVLFITKDDLADNEPEPPAAAEEEPTEWDEPGESGFDLDPGSWISVMDPSFDLHPNWTSEGGDSRELRYAAGLRGMIDAVSAGDLENFEQAVSEIEEVATDGYPHAQSIMGYLYGFGIMKHQSPSKAFLYHNFAHEKSTQSKMALAYTYYRQEMHEKAAELYAEVAELAVSNFFISKIPPSIEPLRLHKGSEENKQALRKYRGEDDEDFQVMEYQAMRGETEAMYKVGMFFYFGLRGVRQDHRKAMHLFLKAAEKGEARSMELLGEIYARGLGVEKNYTKAFEWLNRASQHLHVSAYNGLGYLHVKGYGLENKNFTKAKEYFERAASNEDPGGYYNLGVLYLKGLGVKKNVALACLSFIKAANAGHPKAIYQVARMFQKGIGLKKNLAMATLYYKIVAEKGPWSSLLSWALESYVKGDVGKALLFYSRMSELGYEVAQSNAAWILDKYSENSLCLGESGFCTDTERYLRAHSLWWKASEQGNEQAALLIGDAYYYGRGTESDYERAAEAYMHAKSQSNAQATFNLGYMHEHGQGLPYDLHLAKRYYDLALESDPAAKLPVTLALTSLWIRKNYVDSFLVDLIDSLPLIFPRVKAWVDNVLMDEGNAAILTLFLCLLTVLYFRERQRQHVVIPQRLDGERNQL